MLSTTSFKVLGDCIHRDPASWHGIGLFYLKPFPPSLQEIAPGWLVIHGTEKDGIILGTFPKDFTLPPDAALSLVCHIKNIATESALAMELLDKLTLQETTPLSTEPEKKGNAKHLTFLLVEDDAMTSRLVARHLEKFGSVITTRNAREATANSAVYVPDIILLDIHYHDDIYDGFDVLSNLLSVNSQTFVVMFSADRLPSTVLKALSMGARGFIAKPFKTSDFSYYINKYAQQ